MSELEFDYRALGRELAARIYASGMAYRPACELIGISPASISRMKAGQAVAVDTGLKACRWLGRDIHDFVKQGEVSRGAH